MIKILIESGAHKPLEQDEVFMHDGELHIVLMVNRTDGSYTIGKLPC